MTKKLWLPILGGFILFSLIFIQNISVDENDANYHNAEEHMLHHLAGNYDISSEELNKCANDFEENEGFEEFIRHLNDSPLFLEHTTYLDTTGDGEDEEVSYKVAIEGNLCTVNQKIVKNGKDIWNNSFNLNRKHLNLYFPEQDYQNDLPNYALFYLGSMLSPFIEKLENNSLYDERSKELARNAEINKDLKPLAAYQSELMKKLNNYQGYFIFNREPGQESIYMWDSEKSQFKAFYFHQSFPA